jgi:hypothetical protein
MELCSCFFEKSEGKMNFSKSILSIVCCVILAGVASGEPSWVQIRDAQDNPPDVDLITNSTDSIVFIVTIPGFFKEDTTYEDTTYQRLFFPKQAVLTDSGFPELPTICCLLAVPKCDSVLVTADGYNPHYFTDYNVFPAPNCPDGLEEPVFCKNDSLYSTKDYYPTSTYYCTGRDQFRDQMCVAVTVRPMAFSPDSNKVFICDSIKIKMTFDNSWGPLEHDVGIFNAAARTMFLNFDLADPSCQTDPGDWNWYSPHNNSGTCI